MEYQEFSMLQPKGDSASIVFSQLFTNNSIDRGRWRNERTMVHYWQELQIWEAWHVTPNVTVEIYEISEY